MKILVIFTAGILIGMYGLKFYQFYFEASAIAVLPAIPNSETNGQAEVNSQTEDKKNLKIKVEGLGTPAKYPKWVPKYAPKAAPSPSNKLYLNLDDVFVRRLEQNWRDLKNMAYTSPEGLGWRIRFLKEQNLFQEAGLKNGDLILYEDLINNQQLSEHSSDVAERIKKILNYLAH